MQVPSLEPPRILPESVDRRLYRAIDGLPHSPIGDRYVSLLSDLGEGPGWVAAGLALAWLGGSKGRRAGLAVSVPSLGPAFGGQRIVKPGFPRPPPWGGEGVLVVGIRTTYAAVSSGRSASAFAPPT